MSCPTNWMTLESAGGRTEFKPGEAVSGSASWSLDTPPETVEVRLFWHTEGKGTQDVLVVDKMRVENPQMSDRRDFQFEFPPSPYTFSGKLISLRWAVEVVAEPSEEAQRLEITFSPTGVEILLPQGGTDPS